MIFKNLSYPKNTPFLKAQSFLFKKPKILMEFCPKKSGYKINKKGFQALGRSLTLIALSSLTACSSIYNDSFDCKAGKGVPCKSISEINTMVSRGELGRSEASHKTESGDIDVASLPSFRDSVASATPITKGVYRVPEQTLRVWMAPHLEEGGTWSGARYLYTVVTPGRWVEGRKGGDSDSTSTEIRPSDMSAVSLPNLTGSRS